MQMVDPQALNATLATFNAAFNILARAQMDFFNQLRQELERSSSGNIAISMNPSFTITTNEVTFSFSNPIHVEVSSPPSKVVEVPMSAQRLEEERIRQQREAAERKRLEDEVERKRLEAEHQRLENERIEKQKEDERQAQIEEERIRNEVRSHPVHRFCYPNGMHHFSQNYNEVGNGRHEGVAFYSVGRSTMEIHRLYHPERGTHYFTADWGEKERFIRDGWRYEGVAFYGSHTGSPVWRIWQPGSGDVILTTNSNEFHTLQSQGWQGGCVMCHTYIL